MAYKPIPTKTEGGQKKAWASDDNTKEGLELLLEELQRLTVLKGDTDALQVSLAAGSLPIKLKALSVPVTTALTLTTANTAYKMPTSELAGRRLLVVYNVSDTSVYIGSSSVTTTTGVLLSAGGVMNVDCEKDLYAICGTAGKIVNLLEFA